MEAIFVGLVVTIVGGVTVQIIRKYMIDRDSPLPFPTPKLNEAYSYLGGTWHEYHITKNLHRYTEPFWLMDTWKVDIRDGRRVRATLETSLAHETGKYVLVGEIRQGRMIITGSSVQTPQDFFTSIFPDLTIEGSEDWIVGTMMAFDYDNTFYTSPVVWSRRNNLTLAELNTIRAQLGRSEKPLYHFEGPEMKHLVNGTGKCENEALQNVTQP